MIPSISEEEKGNDDDVDNNKTQPCHQSSSPSSLSYDDSDYHYSYYYYHPMVLCIVALCIKILLLPSYKSTDFDVHRNWLALTRRIPLREWYTDDMQGHTVHTLDYPPLFAFFEYLLSHSYWTTTWLLQKGVVSERCFMSLPDDNNSVDYRTCVVFHRCTVIFMGDFIFWIGTWFFSNTLFVHSSSSSKKTRNKLFAFIVLNPGLLILDHIHFQYNGMLMGILFLSLTCLLRGQEQKEWTEDDCQPWLSHTYFTWDIGGAIFFTILLSMKHLYLILVPFYFIYLLRHYCFILLRLGDVGSSHRMESNSSFPRTFVDDTTTHTSTTTTATTQHEKIITTTVTFSWKRFLFLASITLITFLVPLIPFLVTITTSKAETKDDHLLLLPSTSSSSSSSSLSPRFTVTFHSQQFTFSLHLLYSIGKRLFPFQRGLCHTYWAGNIWALYLFGNKILTWIWNYCLVKYYTSVLKRTRLPLWTPTTVTSLLPTIPPWLCAICLFITLIPGMICAWKVATDSHLVLRYSHRGNSSITKMETKTITNTLEAKTENELSSPSTISSSSHTSLSSSSSTSNNSSSSSMIFLEGILYSSFCGFMLSYHVHEKAIMTCILPMTYMVFHANTSPSSSSTETEKNILRHRFFRLVTYGHFGLLPLLYQSTENALKIGLYFIYLLWLISEWDEKTTTKENDDDTLLWREKRMNKKNRMNIVAVCSTSITLIYTEIIHPILCKMDPRWNRWEFLPLLMTSIVCALGLTHGWIESAWKIRYFLYKRDMKSDT